MSERKFGSELDLALGAGRGAVIFPNEDVLIVADGFPKFVRLNRPNVSKRNWNFSRS